MDAAGGRHHRPRLPRVRRWRLSARRSTTRCSKLAKRQSMPDLRSFTLWARELLTKEAQELLVQVYGLDKNGDFVPLQKLAVLGRHAEVRETRARLERLLADEEDAGVARPDAYRKLVKEVAFTHLNRLVAVKMLEARKVIRGTID